MIMSEGNGPRPQTGWLSKALNTLRTIVMTVRRSFRPLILTSVFYRIIALTVLTPLASGYAGMLLAKSGHVVIANEVIAEFLLRPIGLLILLVIAACGLTLIALEQACLMSVLIRKPEQRPLTTAIEAVRQVFKRFFAIHALALRIVFRLLAISSPFILLAWVLYVSLLGEHDINYYLANWPLEFKLAVTGVSLLILTLSIILIREAARVVLSLPILLVEAKTPIQALKESRKRSAGRGFSMALSMIAWAVAALSVSSLIAAAFIWAGRLGLPFLLGSSAVLIPATGLWFIGFSLGQLAVSIAATAAFGVLVMTMYGKPMSRGDGLNGGPESVISARPGLTRPISVGKVIGLVGIAWVIAAITGWALLSQADLDDRTQIVAHRGASGAAPENTLAAVDQAIADGAHWVEIDVQRTADDQVVVIHDRDLMRIGKVALTVTQTPYAELAQIDIGSWFDPNFSDQRIPTLQAVLGQCKGKIKVNIELKYYAWDLQLADRVIAIVEELNMENSIVIMSLRPEAVSQVKAERPDWQVGLLAAAALTDLTRVKADFLAVHSKMVTSGFVRRTHRSGKTIQVWTINDTVGMTKMFGMGVDAIITDEPGRAVRLLAQRAIMDPLERLLVTAGLVVMGDETHIDPATEGL
jgi:glycerophosphoryl diester phosphodiesterase